MRVLKVPDTYHPVIFSLIGGDVEYLSFITERGQPSRDFWLMPRDMHGSWLIVAPKPLPKVRTHADLDCAYHKRGNCIVVNNNDGLYGPGGKGGGVSDLDLKACDSMNCNDQVSIAPHVPDSGGKAPDV